MCVLDLCHPSIKQLLEGKKEIYPTPLIIKEIEIKTTMRYHLIPVRMAIIKKKKTDKYWRGMEKKEPLGFLVGMQIDTSKTPIKLVEFLKRNEIKTRSTK